MRVFLIIPTLIAFWVSSGMSHPEKKETGRKTTLVNQENIVASFAKLKPAVATLTEKSELILYEGLPHQTWDRKLLESELKKKATVSRHGFPFYKRPNPVTEKDAKTLLALAKDPKSFAPFTPHKRCGGFHPDFSLVWKSGNEDLEMHVCFGCHEIKVYKGNVTVHCDIRGETYNKLKKLLANYQKQRPKP